MRIIRLGFVYLFSSIVLMYMGSKSSVTGAVVLEKSVEISFISLLGFVFLAISFILYASIRSLDAIIIPGQTNERRTREKAAFAAEYYRKHGAKVIIASGGKTPLLDPKYRSEAEIIYKTLVEKGLPKDKIILEEESRDNVSNILCSLKYVRGHNIGIVSYPKHLDRFEYIIEQGKKEGVIDKRLKVHRIETDEKLAEKLYEIPAGIITRRSLKKGLKDVHVPEGLLKRITNYVMKRFS